MGAGIAAGVAAMSILWLRTQSPSEPNLAGNGAAETITLTPEPVSTVALNGATGKHSDGRPESRPEYGQQRRT